MLSRLALPVAVLIIFIFQADFIVGVPQAQPHHHQQRGHLSLRWFPFDFPSSFWNGNTQNKPATPSSQASKTTPESTIISPSSPPAQANPPPSPSPASTNSVPSSSPASTNSVPSPSPASTNSVPPSSTAPSTPSPASVTSTTNSSANTTSPTQNTSSSGGGKCQRIRIRKEWRKMSRQEQIDYTTAVKCLTVKPSKLMPGGAYRRYDDFENVHSRMRHKIHWIASFLPWHRHFMFLWEQALQTECGYKGSLPRWDWTLDSDDMTLSPVWSADPQIGFGSNGKDFTKDPSNLGGGAVEDGAFANLQLYYPDEHTLARNYNLPQQFARDGRTWGSQFFDAKAMAYVQAQNTYPDFAVALEGIDPAKGNTSYVGPHSIIHVIIGGDISPTSYAANEWHWSKWVKANRRTRLNAYGGITKGGSTINNAKLSDPLTYLNLGPNPTVRDTMDHTAYPYCYDCKIYPLKDSHDDSTDIHLMKTSNLA
ncbi:hypothetical protein DFH28DRAFT_1132019 [Melampsora americana]|nr:hypothetical protein DFH28DRAFT_1132019 [Melampsora americana]